MRSFLITQDDFIWFCHIWPFNGTNIFLFFTLDMAFCLLKMHAQFIFKVELNGNLNSAFCSHHIWKRLAIVLFWLKSNVSHACKCTSFFSLFCFLLCRYIVVIPVAISHRWLVTCLDNLHNVRKCCYVAKLRVCSTFVIGH